MLWLFFIAALTMAIAPSGVELRSVPHTALFGSVSFGAGDTRVGVSLPSLSSPFVGPIFADAVKQASPWFSSSALHLDASGNVLSLGRGQVANSTIFASANYPSGDYTLLYDGTGMLEVAGAATLQQAPGRAIVRIQANAGGLHLRLSATAPNDPVRNIRLVLPGYAATYATQPFLPNAVNELRQFHVLRFEQWSRVAVDTAVESWPFRATPSNFTQAGATGVAPEYAIALANATGDDPWFVLPVGATDAYVTHLAELVGATLDPRLHPIFQFAEDPLARGTASAAYATVAGLAQRRASDRNQRCQ